MERRKFIRNSLALVTPTMISGNAIHVLQDHPLLNTSLLSTSNTDKVLVIVQLSGGNDGLNTVIPLSNYANYQNARTNIALPENKVLKLMGNNATGIHPSMTAFQNMFTDGKLNIVQSVGYPQPSFSHFRATDIWMSGSDSDQYLNTGWAGRFLNYEYADYPDAYPNKTNPDPIAIQIGSLSTLTCQGPAVNMALSISDPSSFYNLIEGTDAVSANTNAGYELSFIRSIAKQTNLYTVRIKQASDSVTQQVAYPNNNLAAQLKIVARLIKGGLQTKVYLVNYGGFDTHSGQVVSSDTTTGSHANLLKVLSDSIAAFQSDMTGLEIEDRVIGMTYSEFGRRIKSNASGGTDHGAAAPLFLFGKNVRGGVFGENPAIPAAATSNDNIPYQFDFRSVYNTILQNWFCVSATAEIEILLKQFPTIPLINASVCGIKDKNSVFTKETLIYNYPNPFTNMTKIEFKTNGGNTSLLLLNGEGTVIQILVEANYSFAGTNSYILYGAGLSAGVYYIRLQNVDKTSIKAIVKI
ncbi:MAG: DUF1501 domain-containing protein [Sediminibacterium sp.]|jgi:uncharacterized protein (DUF1501 family)|nr:DUF1501 domain-containing protein [Sediminibacterium sp.]